MPSVTHEQTGRLRHRSVIRNPMVCVVDPKTNDYQRWPEAAQGRVRIVGSAEEALRLSRTVVIDRWVVNTELPGLSGFDLCRMLASQSAGAPVYLVADEYSPMAEQTAWRSRATMFVVKSADGDWLDSMTQ